MVCLVVSDACLFGALIMLAIPIPAPPAQSLASGATASVTNALNEEKEKMQSDPTVPDPIGVARELGLSLLFSMGDEATLGTIYWPLCGVTAV